jgi:putative transposase
VANFTYIWTAEGWLYAAAVLDLYSRRIVGWSMQESMTSQLVVDALMMAVWRRGKPLALLHHSDQGSQYTSEHFQQLLKEQGITCSMSRAGEVWDNSAMESFVSSLKTERTARKAYRTREQARADVFDYIERFYNPTRRHSTLGYVSPIEFEKAAKA